VLQDLLKRIRSMADEPEEQIATSLPLAVSALLLEVAYADQRASDEELAQIRRVMADTFALSQTEIESLLDESFEHYQTSVGAQSLTRVLTEAWSEAQRYQLVVALWQVALAQDGISALEEHRIRHIADLLYLSHKRFIQAKQQARQQSA